MDGFDPCECVFNHEAAMTRLLNWLRNAQNLCNGSECPTPQNGPQMDGAIPVWFIALGWIVVATALFLMRPASLRSRPDALEKRGGGAPPSGDGNGNGNGNDRNDPPAIF